MWGIKHEIKLMRWWEKIIFQWPSINPLVNLKTDLGKLILNLNAVYEKKKKKKEMANLQ